MATTKPQAEKKEVKKTPAKAPAKSAKKAAPKKKPEEVKTEASEAPETPVAAQPAEPEKPKAQPKAKTTKKKAAPKQEEPVAEPVKQEEAEPQAEAQSEPAEEVKPQPKAKSGKKKSSKKKEQAKAEQEEADAEAEKEKAKRVRIKPARRNNRRLESILDLNQNNIWDFDEYAIEDAWEREKEEEDFSVSEAKLLNIIRLVYEVVHYDAANERDVAKYENGEWGVLVHCKEEKGCVAIRRKAIERITDLSYENIRHISTAMLLELINRNFGGGWDSIALSIRDIIETGFDISTTQLPQSRIHAPGGTVEKKVAQGFDVLEIAKGTWVEAIFAKKKDPVEKIHATLPERLYDEDGAPLSLTDDIDQTSENEEENLENDDTYFSSLTPESDVKEFEEEGLSVDDVMQGEEDED